MSSGSASESCCFSQSCACDDWLTAFCDYEQLTLSYCDEVTVFQFGRSKDVPIEVVDPGNGVFSADRIFEISMQEQTVDVGVGGTITDSDDTEWQIYRVENLRAFCIKRLWGRSVSACFGLLDTVEILQLNCDCEGCGTVEQWDLVGRVRGKIRAESGTARSRNDSDDVAYRYAGKMVRWPLSCLPGSHHRLRSRGKTYRIVSFRDDGEFVPFTLVLEPEHADCAIRGSH